MTSPEEENFLRIVYLHYRVVTPVLKRFFDGNHPNLSADLNLATNRAILSNLHNPPPRSRRILFAQQWKTLYPPTGSPPVVSTDLDLTLMVCLLRNISPVVVAPEPSGFDQLPLPSDISDDSECEIAMVTVRRENELNIDKLQQHLNKYVDPILTSKRIDCCVKSTSDIVEIYIQRMIADWMQGMQMPVYVSRIETM
ncbi:uncharacterized protein LOC143052059 [Mytilus galloprovincialis]|uniref:uncharacterized protein LOC143052059 n=1 Tax=Mytilus galloprovincialis TaxID=29158 RepID=UPI003F7C2063